MALSTTNLNTPPPSTTSIFDKKLKIQNLRSYHEKAKLISSKDTFIPKLAYIDKQSNIKVVGFFPAELELDDNIYIEFVNTEYESEDSSKTLWLFKKQTNYKDLYPVTPPHPISHHIRYLVPITELVRVTTEKKENAIITEDFLEKLPDLPDANTDAPMSQMTIRDKAAIDWKLPISHKKWLNELIITNFKCNE